MIPPQLLAAVPQVGEILEEAMNFLSGIGRNKNPNTAEIARLEKSLQALVAKGKEIDAKYEQAKTAYQRESDRANEILEELKRNAGNL